TSSDAVLGERRAAKPDGFAAKSQDGLASRFDVGVGTGDDVRMQVAVRDVPPDGRVESAPRELSLVAVEQLREAFDGADHVGRRFLDPRIDAPLRESDSAIHR